MFTKSLISALAASLCIAATAPASAQEPIRIVGRVVDAKAVPIANATLVLTSDAGRLITVHTDQNGQYALFGLEDGDYTMRLVTQGYAEDDARCPLTAGETGRFDFRALPDNGDTERFLYPCNIEAPIIPHWKV